MPIRNVRSAREAKGFNMEERKDNNKNIKLLWETLKEEKLKSLMDDVKQVQAKAFSIVKKLTEKETQLRKAMQDALKESETADNSSDNDVVDADIPEIETTAKSAAKTKSKSKASEKAKKEEIENVSANTEKESEVSDKTAAKSKGKTKKAESKDEKDSKISEEIKEDSKSESSAKSKSADKESTEVSADKADKKATTDDSAQTKVKDAKADKSYKEKASNNPEISEKDEKNEKPLKTDKVSEKSEVKGGKAEPVKEEVKKEETKEEKPAPRILSFIVKKADPKAEALEKKENERRKALRNERSRDGRNGVRPTGDRPANGNGRGGNGKPMGARDNSNANASKLLGSIKRPHEISFVPPKENKPVHKKNEKSFEDKRNALKRPLKKELTIEDFDENKTGYRKVRKPKQKKETQSNFIKIEKAVLTKEITPIKELSEKFGISAVEITKRLFKEGIIKTINDSIDYDTAAFIASDLGIEVELKIEKSAEDLMNEVFMDEVSSAELEKRPPVVTVMGHVDHGKTSLLDRIRSANVASGEAGGITQHIGAYSVDVHGNKITFIDTPGHAAFTAMRARGAQVTDIAIIVVAADDGIMPQTIEAINHAKAAGVSIIIAANKVDKPHVDLDRLRQQLSEQDLLVEEWGGDIMMVPVSAKTGVGMDKLMESIILVSELLDLKATADSKARGTVIEAKLDKGKGPLATVLVQNGTLRTGDNIVAGTVVGHVRAMINDKGAIVKEAGPSTAVSVLGLEDVPNAGDSLFAVDEEKLSKLVAQERKNKEREEMIRLQQKVTLDDLFAKISEGELKNLNLIVKADVQGSAEAVRQSLAELSNDEVKVSIIHAGVGAINETDVTLAESSNAIIIGFNVRPDSKAKVSAECSHIDIKLYRVIYDAIEDVKNAMKGMLAPKFTDVYTGKAEVREVFKISGVGIVAGCHVTDGKVVRQAKLRIYRNDVMICEGNVKQLKRFKDEVKEVNQGFECGISIEGFNDIKVGDFIESYIVEETK